MGEDRPIGTEFHVSVQLANDVSQQWRSVGKRHAHFGKVEYVKKRSAVLVYLYDLMLARCNGTKMDKIGVLGEDGPIWAEFHASVQLANAVSQQRRIVGTRHAHFWKVECVKKKSAVLLYLYE